MALACWFLSATAVTAQLFDQADSEAIYTNDYGLSIYPDYPPTIGQTVTLRLRSLAPVQKVSLYSDREEKIPMTYRRGYWWGSFTMPDDYIEGSHFFTVWLRKTKFDPRGLKPVWEKSIVWYKAVKPGADQLLDASTEEGFLGEPEISRPLEPLVGVGETVEVLASPSSPEVAGLRISGGQSITVRSRSLEGSLEGYSPGTEQIREESLRINVAGRAAGTDIEASLFRTTASGVAQVGERDEQVSILLRQGSNEAYLGDFTADLTDTEFTRLDRVLSGARVSADYQTWGVLALYSSPRGQSKVTRLYGDGGQGPYYLGSAPVVIDSERVLIDGVAQKRGDDYTIDYQAGTISFIKAVIDAKSVIQVNYDFRQSAYQHATIGLRTFIRPKENLKLALIYLDDSDSLARASEIHQSMSQEVISPQSHSVLGVDSSFVSELFSGDLEAAYSQKNLDLLSAAGTQESGRAAKLNVSSNLGPWGISGHLKRVGAKFSPIADPDPKQDVWEYGGALSFRYNGVFASQYGHDYAKYVQDDTIYENLYRQAQAKFTPLAKPSLEYQFSEIKESNDPVTGDQIIRTITKNSVESVYRYGVIGSSLRGSVEKWETQVPSSEATLYKRVNFGLATVGIDKISFASNVELETRQLSVTNEASRQSYNLNLSASPNQQTFLSSALQVVDDSLDGYSSVADLAYRLKPWAGLDFEGKYTINQVCESFPTTAEAVSKQTGSFSLNWRPHSLWRLRYFFKPDFTRLARNNALIYNNEQRQIEANLYPASGSLFGLVYKSGQNYNVDKDDYPNYCVKESGQDSHGVLYTLKLAPLSIMSLELNYLLEQAASETLVATQEPWIYEPGYLQNQQFDLIVRTSLSESFSLDSRYTYQKNDQGSSEALSNVVDTKNHTALLKLNWRFNSQLTFYLAGSYSRLTDYLLSQVTYTLAPGAGLIYRFGDQLRIDFDYTYTKSFSGSETAKNNYDLKTKYALSEFVDFIFQLQQEVGLKPAYRLIDLTANLEIKL